MWQAGILILYLIHYVHTGNDPRCPVLNRSVRCKSYLKVDQCQTDTNCHGGKVCCPQKCGKDCVTPIPAKPRPGVCPSVPKDVPEICKRIRVISNCHVDTDCRSRNQKCCRKPCGNFACTDPLKGDRPGCPVCLNNQGSTECPVCVRYQQLCNADTECKPGQMCCFNPSCGTSCKGKVCPEILCPLIKCSLGFQKDENGCEICKCRQDPCPMYSPPPPWLCTDGKAKIFYVDGVKCYGPPGIIPCNKDCRLPKQPGPCKGSFPRYFFNLKTMKCEKFIYGGCQGNANNFELLTECQDKCIDKPRPKCPPLCEIFCPFGNVIDKNNCPICKCKTGCTDIASPLPSVSCGLGKPRCPSKYQCKTAQNGVGVCCPYECPLYKCKSCPYGYVIDANGCQTCTCKPRCGPVCAIFCPFGNVLDENNCPTCRCKTGCKGNVSPLGSISCGSGQQRCPARYQCNTPSAGGSGVCCPYVCPQIKCSRPCPYGYKSDVNVCQTCQCLPACEKGTPQGTCRFGPLDSKPCPSGTYCKNSVCCKIPCKFGDPHPTLSCGMVIGSNKCPAGYSCLGGPADEYFACCPDENKPTPDKCPRDRYPNSRCYVRRSCRNDSSCLGKKKCCKQGCQYKCVNPVY
ncbi:uncharacterized protein ZC84.1-like [Mytilus californianus]|uniref:uncharacterized protein ZC84.1-like n=1 Tax=Mytilus californianus TaxID=6549 RepID=UPI002245422D|nr:uncharacterized protein ZC84.1-like [Mytilus californianus]